jgi:hypothetical protein
MRANATEKNQRFVESYLESSAQTFATKFIVIPGELARPGIREFKDIWMPVFTGMTAWVLVQLFDKLQRQHNSRRTLFVFVKSPCEAVLPRL